ncbi:MAG: patatin-like phospholipase family protein [Proteobacteria bacterium]|nr:patatin-like phospholipase family protein [Pseudomonadota bacterium]MBU6425922.1 patatin-like phospholipase family protein [Rhodospirillales bacterium]
MPTHTPPRSGTVLALQGGGAHGAFTWGALDLLLEAGLGFDAIAGVSSGAMIAAMAVQGMVNGGRQGARETVSMLWTKVMEGNLFGNIPVTPLDWMWDTTKALSQDFAWTGLTQALRLFDPAQLNPMGQNPLEPLLRELLDVPALRSPGAARLYVGATDVESGESVVFSNKQVGISELLASACIPMMFPAVEIKGRHYWDGGYSCNPPLAPVLTPRPERLILIRAQPRRRQGVPSSTADIVHRLHEIAFQAPLSAELSMLPRQVKLLDICADEALARHPLSSKLNTDRPFLEQLFAAGRKAAAAALQAA